MVDSVGDLIGQQDRDSQDVKTQFGTTVDAAAYLNQFTKKFVTNQGPARLMTRDTSTDTIWGRFNWGTPNWDGTYDNSLVVQRVVNPNNIFREFFRYNMFVNTTSTSATLDLTNHNVTFTSGQIFVTETIQMNQNDIIKVKPSVTASDDSVSFGSGGTLKFDTAGGGFDEGTFGNDVLLEVSANSGSTFEVVANNAFTNLSNTGGDLRFRITSNIGSLQIDNFSIEIEEA